MIEYRIYNHWRIYALLCIIGGMLFLILAACVPERSYSSQDIDAAVNGANRILRTVLENTPQTNVETTQALVKTNNWLMIGLIISAVLVVAVAVMAIWQAQQNQRRQTELLHAILAQQTTRQQLPAPQLIQVRLPDGSQGMVTMRSDETYQEYFQRVQRQAQLHGAQILYVEEPR